MQKKAGFTLTEAVTSLTILSISIGMIVGGYMFLQRNENEQIAVDTLDSDLRMTVLRIQSEMQLSSLTEMVYYPATAQKYTAVSFPAYLSTAVEDAKKDDSWDSTVVYHVFGSGSEQKLMRTVFSPRDNSLTTVERQAQLEQVVEDGNGYAARNGANASTHCLFQHVFDWSIEPQGNSYDGYNSQLCLDQAASLGTFLLHPGEHTLTITSTGKDARSSGLRVGLDTLRLTTSGLAREAEALPVTGAVDPSVDYNASGTWSGYHQLSFEPMQTGDKINVSFYNDCWEETNFDLIGCAKSNVTVGGIDPSYSPADLALRLNGNTTNWQAEVQTGSEQGLSWFGNTFSGAFVRTLIRGEEMSYGNSLEHDGAKCRLAFTASDGKDLYIKAAYIDELKESLDSTPDTMGTPVQLAFNSGNTSCLIPAGESAWTDYADFEIHREKSYAVTFQVSDSENKCVPKLWTESNEITGSYLLPAFACPDEECLVATNWSQNSDVIELLAVVGTHWLYTSYPHKGVYESAPVDTQMKTPVFETISWTADCPANTYLEIKARSASSSDMSDASDWTSIGVEPTSGGIPSISSQRYIQYRAALYSTDGFSTPKLRDLLIQWPGEARMVDIGGTFVNGPEYGQFEATVDNQPLSSPLRITLQLREDIVGFKNEMKTVYAEATVEVTPRNANLE